MCVYVHDVGQMQAYIVSCLLEGDLADASVLFLFVVSDIIKTNV